MMQKEEWLKRIATFSADCPKGFAERIIVSFDDFKNFVLPQAAGGNTYAGTIAHAILEWHRAAVHVKEAEKRPLCLTCDTEFWFVPASHKWCMPTGFHIILPFMMQKTSTAVVTGICAECFTNKDLNEKIIQQLRTIWPELYVAEGGQG